MNAYGTIYEGFQIKIQDDGVQEVQKDDSLSMVFQCKLCKVICFGDFCGKTL